MESVSESWLSSLSSGVECSRLVSAGLEEFCECVDRVGSVERGVWSMRREGGGGEAQVIHILCVRVNCEGTMCEDPFRMNFEP